MGLPRLLGILNVNTLNRSTHLSTHYSPLVQPHSVNDRALNVRHLMVGTLRSCNCCVHCKKWNGLFA